ncbi:MAG: hypothetical protein VX617_03885, partial [Pseudomonadota bacterium]|nr:hypothetical protein [Pseudomonadota bacterium]
MIGNTKYAGRDLYAVEGLKYMPKLLSMVDQNPTSPTYGCGDRQYWLYKQIDFPSGMYGEFALPLALTYRYPHPSNPYYREPKIRQLALAVIRFQDRMSHRDGSADDFFPFERALGATAFSLYAMAEASHVLGVTDDDILAFIVRRAEWLARSSETGQLSNHHALAALGLAVANQLTGEPLFKHASLEFRDRVIKWQSDEGWFPEYDGFDPGYDTFTISFLAYLRLKMADDTLTEPLKRAVQLAANLVGPDGSYGGEIGSRNSYHYLPHGFELLASEFESALYMADQFLMSLENDRRSSLDENRTFCHYQYNYLQSWHDFADR